MKKTVRLFTLILGLVAVGTFTSFAQEGDDKKPERPQRGERGERPEGERGERRGRRGPGAGRELTEEQKAAMEKRRAEFEALRKKFAGDDGKLDEKERAAMMEAMLIKRFDADGNGVLEGEEKTKAEEAKKRRGRGRGPRGEGRGPGRRPGGPRGGGDKGGEDKGPEA